MFYVSVVKMYKLRETSFMMASQQVEIWARDIWEKKQVADCEVPCKVGSPLHTIRIADGNGMCVVSSDTKRDSILAIYDLTTIDKRIPMLRWSGPINYTYRSMKVSEIRCLETSGFAYPPSQPDTLEHSVYPSCAQEPYTFLWAIRWPTWKNNNSIIPNRLNYFEVFIVSA
jgi:hypothetical protein